MLFDEYDPRDGKQVQVLNKDGLIINSQLEPKLSDDDLLKLYDAMITVRVMDTKALSLQRSGRMGTFAQVTGQEAQVGVGLMMKKSDWMFPSFRETGVFVVRGTPLHLFFLTFMGSEEGNRMPEDLHNFPISVPVATQTLHAVGAGWAAKIKKEKIATVTFLGDGGTSEGDFHEAMNFAGVMKAPTVFVCQNNQYAISVPRSKQTASKTIAEKAFAYGFPGIQVDGNDVLAVCVAMKAALERAYKGEGPTLLELVTYRLCPHTTSDDPTLYRSDDEVKEWEKKDPVKRFAAYLKKKRVLTDAQEELIQKKAEEKVNEAVQKAEDVRAAMEIEDIFRYTFKTMPPHLKEQLDSLRQTQSLRGKPNA
jgi:pyruvate dehydrogenase E1 component alpha subunit